MVYSATKYQLILAVQTGISLAFLIMLIKVNLSMTAAEKKVVYEQKRFALLNTVLDSFQKFASTADTIRNSKVVASRNVRTSLVLKELRDKNKIHIDTTSQNNSRRMSASQQKIPIIETQLPLSSFTTYTYNFPSELYVGSSDITQVSGDILVKNNSAGLPEGIRITTNMKELVEDAGTPKPISFSLLRALISPDSTIQCIYREKGQQSENEYGLPSYQRTLTFTLSGSLKNKTLDGMLNWYEVSGRPAYAKFKLTLQLK